jgi:hypothetical protein
MTKQHNRRPPNAGKGRVKGVPNKHTADVRQAVSLFAQKRASDVDRWVQQTAEGIKETVGSGKRAKAVWIVKPDPGKAAQIYFGAIEYHIPKLSRTELSTGSDTLKVEIVDPTRRDSSAAK